jgi:regulator of protease activity HflC (stomatin/prohibitin superfamily)
MGPDAPLSVVVLAALPILWIALTLRIVKQYERGVRIRLARIVGESSRLTYSNAELLTEGRSPCDG